MTDDALAFGADADRATAMKARAKAKTTSLAVSLLITLVPILNPFFVTSEQGPRHWEGIGGPHINRCQTTEREAKISDVRHGCRRINPKNSGRYLKILLLR